MSDDCGATWRQIAGHRPPAYASFDGVAVATDPEGRIFIAGGVNRDLHVQRPNQETEGQLTIHYGVGTSAIAQRGLCVSAAGRLYVRTGSGLSVRNVDGFHYSDDGGETWTIRRRGAPYMFAADPLDRAVVYGYWGQRQDQVRPEPTPGIPADRLTQSPPYQLLRSIDSGETFHPWSEVQEVPGVIGVSVDGSRFWFASYGQHLWQSRDGGQSWQIVDTMPFTAPVQIVGSPHDPRVIYAVSEDGQIWAYREPGAAPVQLPAAR